MNPKYFIFLAFTTLFSMAVAANSSSLQAQPSDEAAKQPEQQVPAEMQLAIWFQRAAEAYAAEDHRAWVTALENLHRLRPLNYDFMRQLVMGYSLTGKTSKAFNMMLRMQQQGLAVDWDGVEEVEVLRQYPLYPHLRDLMKTAGEPVGDASEVFAISADYP